MLAASDVLRGWYLVDTQAHYNANDAELVEGGQVMGVFDPAGAR